MAVSLSQRMSQIATFTYLKESDIPFLGFWSKPKKRLFRRPECMFGVLLKEHQLRSSVFDDGDGSYVELVFMQLELLDAQFRNEHDPVLDTVRARVEGSHWLVTHSDRRLARWLNQQLNEGEWLDFLRQVDAIEFGYLLSRFEKARWFVKSCIENLNPEEAALVSIG